jgi:predicted alpha/beta-fold hydrolase
MCWTLAPVDEGSRLGDSVKLDRRGVYVRDKKRTKRRVGIVGSVLIDLDPPALLRSPHVQTVLSSRIAGRIRGDDTLLATAKTLTIDCGEGVRLKAVVNDAGPQAQLIILIHGWLGEANSPYLRHAAGALHDAGFSVARLLLRDHGDTSGLNEAMFNSARIDEVVAACSWLIDRYGALGAGLMGFSLGGNFALRVGRNPDRDPRLGAVLAICPVVDPAKSVEVLDGGWFGYRWYFLRKWRRALREKQAAFPAIYDVEGGLTLPTIAELTDYFVARYTPFANSTEYYTHYTLTNDDFDGVETPARVVAAADDPVIPVDTVRSLKSQGPLDVVVTRFGGHCAYIEDYALGSAVGRHALRYFGDVLRRDG